MGITLEKFIEESNEIEGIRLGDDTDSMDWECLASLDFILKPDTLTVDNISNFVDVVERGARLRNKPGMDVRVGNHKQPRGGSVVEGMLGGILFA